MRRVNFCGLWEYGHTHISVRIPEVVRVVVRRRRNGRGRRGGRRRRRGREGHGGGGRGRSGGRQRRYPFDEQLTGSRLLHLLDYDLRRTILLGLVPMLPLAMADKCGLVSEILIAIGTDGPQAEAGEGGKSVYGVWELAMNVGLLLLLTCAFKLAASGKRSSQCGHCFSSLQIVSLAIVSSYNQKIPTF